MKRLTREELAKVCDEELVTALRHGVYEMTPLVAEDLGKRLVRLHAAVDELADDVGRYVRGESPHPVRDIIARKEAENRQR